MKKDGEHTVTRAALTKNHINRAVAATASTGEVFIPAIIAGILSECQLTKKFSNNARAHTKDTRIIDNAEATKSDTILASKMNSVR
jgi:hypothetical protein